MTDSEQNMVNRLKMLVARIIIDLNDEMVLEIIKVNKEIGNSTSEPVILSGIDSVGNFVRLAREEANDE